MQILYKNKSVEKQFSPQYVKKWKYPKRVSDKLKMTETFIRNAQSLQDIVNYGPFHFHALEGNRKHEWSIYIGAKTGYRVTLIPCDENGKRITKGDIIAMCKSIKIVEITEVSNHYE